MKKLLAVSLLAAGAAVAQTQATPQGNPPQQLQNQQQEAAPAPAQAQAPAAQPIASTNLGQKFNGPTKSEVYCSGFITKQLHPSATIVAGSNAPDQALHSDYEYIYLRGDDVQEGKEYLLLR